MMPNVASTAQFIGAVGTPGLVSAISAGMVSEVGISMAFQVVHQAVTSDSFVPAARDSVAQLASVLAGYSQLGRVARVREIPRINDLLLHNDADVRAAIEHFRTVGGGRPREKIVSPMVERLFQGGMLVHMPEGRLGATRLSKTWGKSPVRLYPGDAELILAAVALKLTEGLLQPEGQIDEGIAFEGLPMHEEIMVVNGSGSAVTTLDELVDFIVAENRCGGRAVGRGETAARSLARLQAQVADVIRSCEGTAQYRLGSLVLGAGDPILLPGISEQENGGTVYVTLPDGMVLGENSGESLLAPDPKVLELVLTALVLKFADGDASRFNDDLLMRPLRPEADGRSKVKRLIVFLGGGRRISACEDGMVITSTRLAHRYARARNFWGRTSQSTFWSNMLVQRVVGEILLARGR
jgi:hypothetical protein